MSRERPLCVLGKDIIYLNIEGLELLQSMINKIKSGSTIATSYVAEDQDWSILQVRLSDQASFETGDSPCKCGCQDLFKDVEADYEAKNR